MSKYNKKVIKKNHARYQMLGKWYWPIPGLFLYGFVKSILSARLISAATAPFLFGEKSDWKFWST